MDIKDARKIVAVMMVSFPSYKPIDTELAAIELSKDLEEYSYQQVDTALRMYKRSNTSGFAPTSGQLISMLHMVEKPQQLNEMEAWSLVRKAIRNSGYHADEEFEKLPPLVQKAVGQPSQLRTWAIGDDYNEAVVSSNFIKTYRVVAQRHEDVSKMPESIADRINEKMTNVYLPHIDEKLPNPNKLSLGENKAVNEDDSMVDGGNSAHTYTKQIQKLREELVSDEQTTQNRAVKNAI